MMSHTVMHQNDLATSEAQSDDSCVAVYLHGQAPLNHLGSTDKNDE